LADWQVRALSVRLNLSELARALHADDCIDTTTLICLSGRWSIGQAAIAWAPQAVVDNVAATTGPGWFGYQAFDEEQSWWGQFDTLLRQDSRQRWWLESTAHADELADRIERIALKAMGGFAPEPPHITALAVTPESTHLAAVERAISAIRSGELYQVNVCARFSGQLQGAPLELFDAGLQQLAPDYAGYLHNGSRTIVSFSPELFLHRADQSVLSAPIKGTRKRSVRGDRLDDPAALELLHSTKDRAENVMITDLVRNDLSRVAEPGSVCTPQLLQIRPAPGVWHLVSEVSAQLRPGITDLDLFAATFPPGSVTGAPKLRALSVIADLEPVARGVFTGAIGYLGVDGSSMLNVAIRTFEFSDATGGGRFELGVGGGITADSVPVPEWRECLIKAAPLLALGDATVNLKPTSWPSEVDVDAGIFDTMLAIDGEIVGLSDHLARFAASVAEVYQRGLPANFAATLADLTKGLRGRHLVRVALRPEDRQPSISVTEAGPPLQRVALRTETGRSGCWRHKWNDRRYLAGFERFNAESEGTDRVAELPLFIGPNSTVLETSRSNIAIVVQPGVILTPQLSDDVLPGITRRRLLDAAADHGWQVDIRDLGLGELYQARLILNLSSTGIVGVGQLDGKLLSVDDQLLTEIRGWLGQ
jgi:para-aminobenzoate synthetase/4-amino-4-deoxychorismate lyase